MKGAATRAATTERENMAVEGEVTSVVAQNAVRRGWGAEVVEDVVRTAVDGGREDEREAPEEPPPLRWALPRYLA